jgi:hypothetical protein
LGHSTKTWLVVSLSLSSACSFFGVHPFDQGKAKEYAHLDVQQFVKQRFVDEQRTFLDDMSDHIPSTSSQPSASDIIGKPGLREDGRSVVYDAAFTSVNYDQLVRPRRELELYCGAQSGTFSTLEAPASNYVRDHFQEGASKRLTFARPPSADSKHVHIGPKNGGSTAPGFDEAGGVAGFARAQQRGSFGRFACVSSKQQWVVDVTPYGYLANDPYDSLSAHKMTLLVSPQVPGSDAPAAEQTLQAAPMAASGGQSEQAPLAPVSAAPAPQLAQQSNPDLDRVRAALAQRRAQSGAAPSTAATAP